LKRNADRELQLGKEQAEDEGEVPFESESLEHIYVLFVFFCKVIATTD
jgi:hypothetical protein